MLNYVIAMRTYTLLIAFIACLPMRAQTAATWADEWVVESESPDYSVTASGDTLEVMARKGLTLWYKPQLTGPVTIEYDACIVMEREDDRLSDLNCFWMATDPMSDGDIFALASWRMGIFVNCYTLRLYYLGYGGNHNTTTRFRRYDGDALGVEDPEHRPAILTEYTDSAHLLTANHWYHISITQQDSLTTYTIDGEQIVSYTDPEPLTQGWFGLRTTLARLRFTGFKVTDLSPEGLTDEQLASPEKVSRR